MASSEGLKIRHEAFSVGSAFGGISSLCRHYLKRVLTYCSTSVYSTDSVKAIPERTVVECTRQLPLAVRRFVGVEEKTYKEYR